MTRKFYFCINQIITLQRKRKNLIPFSFGSLGGRKSLRIFLAAMKTKPHSPLNEPVHIYMKGKDGQGLFYSTADCLFFTTLFSVLVRKARIQTLAFCIMFNHVHALLRFPDTESQKAFVTRLVQSFVREYNEEYRRTGPMFLHSYGRARKKTAKQVRSCIAYIGNNPVAGRLCHRAAEYRWNLSAYSRERHPYSASVNLAESRHPVRRAIRFAHVLFRTGRPLTYNAQRQIFHALTGEERKSVLDRILSLYNMLDYASWEHLFGSRDRAFLAMESNTGTEYDLPEDWEDYSKYRDMLRIARADVLKDGRYVEDLSPSETSYLARSIKLRLNASDRQVEKFLHLKLRPTNPGLRI